MRIRKIQTLPDGKEFYGFHCPGCGFTHQVCVLPHRNDQGAGWAFNGDFDLPTFSPSVLVTQDYGDPPRHKRCHSFVSEGRIQFLEDCTHSLAGRTVDLPEISP